MKTILTGAASALSLLAAAASAQAQDGYADHYRAYQAASEADDRDAMLASGEAAWRAAETALGDVETTAILAQNHLYDLMFMDAEGAEAVAARALALGEQGLGLANMSLTELRAASAYVQAAGKPRDDDRREALLSALLADRDTDRPLNPMAIGLYRAGTMLAYGDDDYAGAYDYVAALTDEVRALPEPPATLLATSLLDEAAVLMAGRKPLPVNTLGTRIRPRRSRYEAQLSDAAILLAEAVSLFPEHGSIDTFDPVHARAHAWMAVNEALLASAKMRMDEDHAYQGRTLADFAPDRDGAADQDDAPGCAIDWTKRELRYPRMAREWYNGAVYVGYHIGTDGRIEGARVLSEVPAGRFGPAVVEAMKDWRVDTDGLAPECLRDKTSVMKFVVN